MIRFNKICIVGVGLIGGSIGLGIKKKRLAKEVVGVFRRQGTLNKALKYRAIDRGVMSVEEGVKNADLIILATPVHLIPELAKKAIESAKSGSVITDAGSTKKWIVGKIDAMGGSSRGVYFVGSHPMAGSEHASVEFAKADLVEGSPCIVTRTKNTDKRALAKVVSFWKALGGKVKVTSPEAHDRSVAMISHLPHLVAFSLAGAVPAGDLEFAAEGFKDTTRVASSDPALWADIFLSNKKELLAAGRNFSRYYNQIASAVVKGDHSKVKRLMAAAKNKRDKFTYAKKA